MVGIHSSAAGVAVETEEELLKYIDSDKFKQASSRIPKLVNRLKSDIQANQLYQAHQGLRNIYFRFSSHDDKIEALRGLLYNGAIYLLGRAELITGQDIATLFLETTSKHLQNLIQNDASKSQAEAEIDNSSMAYHIQNDSLALNVCRQVSNLALKVPDSELGRPKFMAETLKLLTPKILNRDLLHNVLALDFWRRGYHADARYHFLHCASLENAEDIGSLLIEYHISNATKSEIDLFITQFLYQLLCLQRPIDSPRPPGNRHDTASPPKSSIGRKSRQAIRSIAEKIFSSYRFKHPALKQCDTSSPLLNFTRFIISILDSQKSEANAFRLLCEIYKSVWSRDPNYQAYLNRIGLLYFGVVDKQKQQQQQGGFFNNILMSLFEGTDDESDDGNDRSSQSNIMSLCDELD